MVQVLRNCPPTSNTKSELSKKVPNEKLENESYIRAVPTWWGAMQYPEGDECLDVNAVELLTQLANEEASFFRSDRCDGENC